MDENGEPVQLEDYEKEGDGGIGDEGLPETRIQQSDIKDEDADVERSVEAETETTAIAAKGRTKKVTKKTLIK